MTQGLADIVLGGMLSVLLGLSGWTLYTVHQLAAAAAANQEKEAAQDQALREDRARIVLTEDKVSNLQQRMVRVEERVGIQS